MTLITKAVTHFRATFEIVLHFRTGARAPILWEKANRGVGACECESLSFAIAFSTAWTTKNPNANSYHLGLLVLGLLLVNFYDNKKLDENHYHWADSADYLHFHLEAD